MSLVVSIADDSENNSLGRYLSTKVDATPYHHKQWIQAIKKAYGFEFRYLIAKTDSRIVGVLPLCLFKNLTGKLSFCSLPYCDVGGVVADDDSTRDKLLQSALDMMDQAGAMQLELRQRLSRMQSEGDMTNRKVSMLLELPASSENLMSSFKSKLRSQIKKAEKNGLTFDFGNDEKCIDDFFHVFSRNMHILGSPTHSIKWFHALRELYQDKMVVGRVWFGDKIVGSGILLFSGDNVSIPWASTLRDYNRLAPNMMLYWNLLRISCERGCGQFDFGRSTYGEGTYKFKLQWGAKPALLDWQFYGNHSVIAENPPGKSKSRNVVESVWKKLPLSVVNAIGPRLRRHISL